MCSTSSSDLSFQFSLPEGLALRGCRFEDNVPFLLFTPCPKMPTIMEEDLAVVLRTVYRDDTYPSFFFHTITNPYHPFIGNWLKTYSPNWIRGTGLGELLFEADWIMKCLMAGVRSNKEMTKYTAWEKSSNLDDFASILDFFPDDNPTSPAVYMSCCPLEVYETDNELWFPEEPKIRIDDHSCKAYSNYITDIFDSIAYHDEPLLLKVREVPKLVLLARWLKGRDVKISVDWMMEKTKPLADNEVQVARRYPPVKELETALNANRVSPNSHTTALVSMIHEVLEIDISDVESVDDRLIKWKETRTVTMPWISESMTQKVTYKVTASFDDFDRIYGGVLSPNMHTDLNSGIWPKINPFTYKVMEPLPVGSWSELSRLVVSTPTVCQPALPGFNKLVAGGGVNLGSVPKVSPTVAPVEQDVMKQKRSTKDGQFRQYSNSLGVAATDNKVKSRQPPKDMLPNVPREFAVPSRFVSVKTEPRRRNKAVQDATGQQPVYGTHNYSTGEMDYYTAGGESVSHRRRLHERHDLEISSSLPQGSTDRYARQTLVSFTKQKSEKGLGCDLRLSLDLLDKANPFPNADDTALPSPMDSGYGTGDSTPCGSVFNFGGTAQ